ncbi:Tetratricopeptide TPR_2 [Fulvivirga imtechensis AK7]|uniref:Tetratricopeptide TPR_2 n=1 Tax=Fulvivirga imtechensis AK7 TaxID=1237149 RepID=L8JLY4_9BACT|nr:tetratricopeptide repeat protein [Fulvivirga imtechensis]ELR68397.1 Tetratricopeptide TPR_2 [Fulvivirga imtechensis AK7]
MSKKLGLLLLILISFNAHPQTLEQLYDSARNSLNLELALEVKDLAIEAQDRDVLGNAYYLIGYIEMFNENHAEALSALLDALIIYRDLDKLKLMAGTQLQLGILYSNAGLEQLAMQYFHDAIATAGEVYDTLQLGRAYHNLGQTQADFFQYDSAIQSLVKSLEFYHNLKNYEMMATCYNNMGLAYQDQKQYEKAIEYFNKALKTYDKTYFRAMILNNLGYLSLVQKDSSTAKGYFIAALELDSSKIKERTLALLHQNLGAIYKSKYPDSSIFHNEKRLFYLKDKYWSMGLVDQYYSGCKVLEELYTRVGNHDKARYYDSLQDAFNVSLVQLHKNLNQSNIRYQIEAAYKNRLDAKTKALEERNQILMYVIILLGVLFISLIIAFWLYFKYKKRTVFIYDRVQKAYQSLEKREIGV